MIDAKELRINNWVEIDGVNRQVLAIDPTNIHKDDIGSITYFLNVTYGNAGRWLTIGV